MIKIISGSLTSPTVFFIDKPEFIKNDGSIITMNIYKHKTMDEFFLINKSVKEIYIFTKESQLLNGQRFVIINAAIIN